MKLNYRKMLVEDLPATLAVRLSTVENAVTIDRLENVYGITPQSMAKAMAADAAGWLCEVSGTVVGFAMGDRSNGEVTVVAVRPEYEGNGIGKTVLSHVTSWLFSEGHGEVWLGANPDSATRAHGFYRKLGWQATGRMTGDDEILVLTAGRKGA